MPKRIIPRVGSKAPAFTLLNQNDEKVKLTDYKDHWLILYFYPKDDTPGCTKEACEFTDNIRDFDKLGTAVLGIFPDSTERHRKFMDRYKLKVNLLSDQDRKVMAKYGAFGTKKMYGKEVQGVIRSTFVVDPKGKIAHVWASVKASDHAEKVKEKLSELI